VANNGNGDNVLCWELVNWVLAIACQAAWLMILPMFLAFWLLVGIFLQMTKTIAMGTVWNVWFRVWTGYGGGLWADTEGSVDSVGFKWDLLCHIGCETIPMIILQSINNTLSGIINITYVSLTL
jgi:hypothetical protein